MWFVVDFGINVHVVILNGLNEAKNDVYIKCITDPMIASSKYEKP